MEIRILQLHEGAENARGLTVVIDVFRAFSLACYISEKPIANYFLTDKIETAYELKKKFPEYILIGERNERKPEGFDYGNSPSHIIPCSFTNKTIVHTSSAGTQGAICSVKNSEEVITGSFVNAQSIAQYILQKNPAEVSLVCMGYAAKYPTEEDTLCALYIKSLLENSYFSIEEEIEKLKFTSGKRLFLPENQEHSPASDFYYCTALNHFPFVLKALKTMDNVSIPENLRSANIIKLDKIMVERNNK